MDAATTAPWTEIVSEPSVASETEAQPELTFGASDENLLWHDCADLLRKAGLRPTRQRLILGEFLFSKVGRHVTAEMLHAEVAYAGIHVSLATVYNTLNQLTDAGLLRQIGVDGSKSYFDTNPTTHHHFFVDHEDRLLDISEPGVLIDKLPQPLPGYEISRVDVMVHLRRKQS